MADYWIYTSERRDPIALTGITDVRRVKIRVPKGTYRNGDSVTPGLATASAHSSAVAADRKASDVPIFGIPDSTVDLALLTNAKWYQPDYVAGVEPRVKWEIVSGYAFAVGGAVPALELLAWTEQNYGRTVPTAVASTLLIPQRRFSATAHGFVTGDLVTLSAATYPVISGSDSSLLTYRVVVTSANGFYLYDVTTGLNSNFTTTGSGISVDMFQPAPRVLPNMYSVVADHTTESFTYTNIEGRSFITGDLVKLYGTLPTGGTFAANTEYEVLLTSVGSFQLLNASTKALMTFTGNGSGISAQLTDPVELPELYDVLNLEQVSNLLFYSDEIVSLVSNVDPNA